MDAKQILAGPRINMLDFDPDGPPLLMVEPLRFLPVRTFTHPVTGDRSDYVADEAHDATRSAA